MHKTEIKVSKVRDRHLFLVIACFTAMVFFFDGAAFSERLRDNLYEYLSAKKEWKTYVQDITVSGAAGEVDAGALREILENALATRMTINFTLAPKKETAEIIIACDVKEFLWMGEPPVDSITGAVGIIIDALSEKNYARMEAVFTVFDREKGKKLWEKELKATVTRSDMDRQSANELASERLVKVFMRECL